MRLTTSFLLTLLMLAKIHPLLAAQAIDFSAYRHKMPPDLVNEVAQDKSIRLIVRYYDASVDTELRRLESASQQDKHQKAHIFALKSQRYSALKAIALAKMDRKRFHLERDYSHLPMNVVTLKGEVGLLELLVDPTVAEVFRDTKLHHFLAQSAPLVKATDVISQTGYSGSNTMVVVLDTGINYTLSDFGSCTSPGIPASCRVKVSQDFAIQDNYLDDNGHGTNVAGIVVGIAKGTELAVFDVFNGSQAPSPHIS